MNRSIQQMTIALSLMASVATVAFAAGWHSSQAAHASKGATASANSDANIQPSFEPIAAAGAHFPLVPERRAQQLTSTSVAFDALRDLKQARAIETDIGTPAKRPARKRSCVKTGA